MQDVRIKLNMNMVDAVVVLSEGNPGAMRVCTELFKKGGKIDPGAAFGGFANLLGLDTLGIYGSRIWLLYKDVCKENLVNVVLILRSHQLGFVTQLEIDHAIDSYGEGIDFESLATKVKERLPQFNLGDTEQTKTESRPLLSGQ